MRTRKFVSLCLHVYIDSFILCFMWLHFVRSILCMYLDIGVKIDYYYYCYTYYTPYMHIRAFSAYSTCSTSSFAVGGGARSRIQSNNTRKTTKKKYRQIWEEKIYCVSEGKSKHSLRVCVYFDQFRHRWYHLHANLPIIFFRERRQILHPCDTFAWIRHVVIDTILCLSYSSSACQYNTHILPPPFLLYNIYMTILFVFVECFCKWHIFYLLGLLVLCHFLSAQFPFQFMHPSILSFHVFVYSLLYYIFTNLLQKIKSEAAGDNDMTHGMLILPYIGVFVTSWEKQRKTAKFNEIENEKCVRCKYSLWCSE